MRATASFIKLCILIFVVLLLGATSYRWELSSNEVVKVLAASVPAHREFGWSVALYGNTAVIGVPDDDDNGPGSGSTYVFVRSDGTWTQQAKLIASDGAGGKFGYSVALEGDTAVIGDPDDDDNGPKSGSVYVFTHFGSVWAEQAKLRAADGVAHDQFGFSVAVNKDTAVIGAPYDDDNGRDSGSAYVFTRSEGMWTQQAKLFLSDNRGAGDKFGYSVAVDDDTAVIAVPREGAVYVFVSAGGVWMQQAKLVADGHLTRPFGSSVAVQGDTVVVGARGDESAYVFTRSGGSWTQQAKLLAADGRMGGNFGASVALDDDTVVIGAPNDYDNGPYSGAVYVFARSGGSWTQQAKLHVSDVGAYDFLGRSIALKDGIAVVGSPGDSPDGLDTGSAHVFALSNDTWTEEAKLFATDRAAGENFGYAVALEGNTAVVGVPGDFENGLASGAAYVFVYSEGTWKTHAKLLPPDGSAGDNFGYTLALEGDTVVIGAPYDSDNGLDSGSVYIFVRSDGTWVHQAKLLAADRTALDKFGHSVAVDGDIVGIGSPGFGSGSVYIFSRAEGMWMQQAKLFAQDGGFFGYSVALEGDTAVIGAPHDDDNGRDSGSAYVFVHSGGSWTQQAKLIAADGAAYDWFGSAVAVNAGTVAIGAPQSGVLGAPPLRSGSTYIFTYSGGTWTEQAKLLAFDRAEGAHFGLSVTVDGDTVLIGAPDDLGVGLGAGSVYVFVGSDSNWTQQTKLFAAGGTANDGFGASVMLMGDTAVIGVPFDDDSGRDSGAGYMFTRSGELWIEQVKLFAHDGLL